ncbi:MAG: DUF3418 domain-containing protein, partial [Acidobacteriota bacterium]|nr:DUF3418 domain-containing protein [Acidobacteriota bacterium]
AGQTGVKQPGANQEATGPQPPEQRENKSEGKPASPSEINGPKIPGTREGEYLPHFFDAFVRAASEVKGVDVKRDLWDDLDLPTHVTPTFVAINEQGREVRTAHDLTWLQKQLSGQSQKAVRSAMRDALDQAIKETGGKRKPNQKTLKALAGVDTGKPGDRKRARQKRPKISPVSSVAEQNGITDWPQLRNSGDVLPNDIEATTSEGLNVRAYPALVPQGTPGAPEAGVRVLPERRQADREHREGLARLVLARTTLATARVSTRWTGREALVLASGPYPNTEKLVADAQLAAVKSLLAEYQIPEFKIRSREAFNELAAWVQDRIEDRIYQILGWTVDAFSEFVDLDREIRRTSSPSMIQLLQNVREHSNGLVYDGFLVQVPYQWLPHLARFIKADRMRIQKASQSADALARDEGKWRSIQDIEGEITTARAQVPLHEVARRRELDHALWLVDELRVSFFAQELGTSQKVSLKRLYSVLDK